MIKGCNKRVIVMKNTGHEMIEEAFFILKPDTDTKKRPTENDILKQANLILDSKKMPSPLGDISLNVTSQRKKTFDFTSFLWGTVVGITITCIIMLISV